MVFRLLVNVGLLAIPMGATVGVLMGIDLHRQATGQAPLFVPDNTTSILPPVATPPKPKDNGTTVSMYCQKQVVVTPLTEGRQYTLNPNQWGWTEGDPGALCMNITTNNNQTYATNDTAPPFSVTWQYPVGPVTAPVHAFPYVQIDHTVMPLPISSLSTIDIDMAWTYGVGNTVAALTDIPALTRNQVNANVAIDMFLDPDAISAQNNTLAKYEVMVWFATIGNGTQPIGLSAGPIATQTINGTTFSLYTGVNGVKQNVLTWVANQTTERFTGDIAPLVNIFPSISSPNASVPTSATYLGYLSLGSETFSSPVNITLDVPKLEIKITSL